MNNRGFAPVIVLGAIALFFLAVGAWSVGIYNGLVVRNENVSKSWATVESQYQRRYDLITNLVETVKGSAKFEKETLTAVVEARARVGSVAVDKKVLDDPASFKKFDDAQAGLSSALSRLMAVAEKYPGIRTTEAYRDLQGQLDGTENRIQAARKDYNDIAQDYNTSIKLFPDSLVASFGGFKERPYFESAPAAAQVPAVKF